MGSRDKPMDVIADFFSHNFVVIYFFYGLAFFSMGLAILVESRRASELPQQTR